MFTWPVFQEYTLDNQWEETPGGLQQEEYIRTNILSGRKEIRPAEHLMIYLELTKVYTSKQALKFARKYGLLTNETEEKVNLFLGHAFELRECLELYQALQTKDYDGITNNKLAALVKKKIFTEAPPEELARQALEEHITGNLKGIGQRMDRLKLMPYCHNLLEAIYLQVAGIIDQGSGLVACKECGSLFAPTRKGQEFCPPQAWEKRSPCQNRYSVRKWRKERGSS